MPELLKFSSDNTFVLVNYGGVFTPTKQYKNVIYSQFGEVCNETTLKDVLDAVPNSNVIVITHRNYSEKIKSRCHIIKLPNYYAWYTTQITSNNIDFGQQCFSRRLLSLHWRGSWNRLALLQFLIREDLLEKFFFSYRGKDIDVPPRTKHDFYFDLHAIIGETWFNQGINHDQIIDLIPIDIDSAVFNRTQWMTTNEFFYRNSFASFINETYIDENYNVFLTEKTFKPIAMGHPFLLFSSAGALSHVRSLGFDTYGDIFDESYDNIDSPHLRFEFLLREIARICNMTDNEIVAMWNHALPKIKRNFDFFKYHWYPKFQQDLNDAIIKIESLLE